MDTLDKLTALEMDAETKGIILDWNAPDNIVSSILNFNGTIVLGINKNINNRSNLTYLAAHEMGHYNTGTYYNLQTPLQVRGQAEYRADEWAAFYLIPLNKLLDAVNLGYTQPWELAEYFDVPESFILRSIYIYQCKGLIA